MCALAHRSLDEQAHNNRMELNASISLHKDQAQPTSALITDTTYEQKGSNTTPPAG